MLRTRVVASVIAVAGLLTLGSAAPAMVGAAALLIVRIAVPLIGLDPRQPILVRDAVISSLSGMFALMVAFSASCGRRGWCPASVRVPSR